MIFRCWMALAVAGSFCTGSALFLHLSPIWCPLLYALAGSFCSTMLSFTFYICLPHGVSSWMSWLNDFAPGLLACSFVSHMVSLVRCLGWRSFQCAVIFFHRISKWCLLLDAFAVSFSNMCCSFPCHMCLHGCILFSLSSS